MDRYDVIRDYYNATDNNNTYRGTSFRCREWVPNARYYHNEKYIDFITYQNCLLMCNKDHISSQSNMPIIVDNGNIFLRDGSYWSIVIAGNINTTTASIIPEGGTEGQVLVKASDKTHDFEWGEWPVPELEATVHEGNTSSAWIKNEDGTWNFNFVIPAGQNGADGQDGENGTDGRDGVDGITPSLKIENGYWYVSYDNGVTWTELGKATGNDGIDGKDGKDGAIGPQGPQGEQGIQGPSGVDGQSNYFHIAYADDEYGNGYNQVSGDYVATYVDSNPEDNQAKFTNWMPFKGAQGEKGDQGIAGTNGTNGVDGTTYYLHIGYASDENGTDFSHDWHDGLDYIGQYVDENIDSSDNPNDYIPWKKYVGDPGPQGKPGKDGVNGEPGPIIYPAGVFSTEKSYKRINDTIPYVEYNNKYYICIGESTGATPDVDAENWSPMTQFDSVFTKLLVADNGTIGQAVYSGDYMFSQSGTKNDGGSSHSSTDYQDFVAHDSIDAILNDESENFIPSLLFNFADGSGYLHGGAIKFDSNGIEIGSDVVIKSDVTIGEFSVNKQDNNRSFVYANNGSWGYDTYTTNKVNTLRAYVNTTEVVINVDLSNYDNLNESKKFIVEGCIVGNSEQFVYFVHANKSIPLDQYGVLQYIAISDDEGRFSESYTVKPLNQVVNTNAAYKLGGITIDGFPSDASKAAVVIYDAYGNPWHVCIKEVVGTSFTCEDEVYSNAKPTSFTVSYIDSNDLEHSEIDVSNATIRIVDDPESNYKIVTIDYTLIEVAALNI